ncbi:MAG: MarR family transcriptional regulator [Bacteroidetes bacterium]|nr:winged helix-turn-helix transcriptional regulator [Bacteroidia bacterium]MBN4052170.1 winged helix-turn-helix transcriptional regulator [Sphingobacteriaceae bacterium AH-315-L07]PCH67635.1 MAG: MarR family transcriptional regulator [Bacteroidota bacterium]
MRKNDFVKELGYLGFTMRLKRISDAMMHEGRRLYSHLDVDIEPNWYVIFKLLKSRGAMSVTEISESIMMAHPSVITITNKMMDAGYLISEKDENDSRKRVLDLSVRASKKLPEYEKIWEAGESGVEKALEGLNALEFISILEDKFFSKGFMQRTIEQLKIKKSC